MGVRVRDEGKGKGEGGGEGTFVPAWGTWCVYRAVRIFLFPRASSTIRGRTTARMTHTTRQEKRKTTIRHWQQNKERQETARQGTTRQDKTRRQEKTREEKTREDKTRQGKTRQDKQDQKTPNRTKQDHTRSGRLSTPTLTLILILNLT